MSDRARHLLHIEHLTRGVLNSPCGHDEIYSGDNNRALRDKKASSLNTIIDSDIPAACAFGRSDVCDEVFGNVDAIQQFQFGHARPPAVAISDHAIAEPYVTEIRRGVAPCIETKQDAASNPGELLTALGHAPGAQCNQNNSIHANTNASPTPHPMASKSVALSDIRNSFAFVARAINSIRSLLRSVVAATCASNSLARPSLAGADREGV